MKPFTGPRALVPHAWEMYSHTRISLQYGRDLLNDVWAYPGGLFHTNGIVFIRLTYRVGWMFLLLLV